MNQYENSFKRVLEQKFPNNQWWEVTNCDIKWSLFNNRNPKQTVKEIVEGLNIREISNGARDDIKITKHSVADKKLDKWAVQPTIAKNEFSNKKKSVKESYLVTRWNNVDLDKLLRVYQDIYNDLYDNDITEDLKLVDLFDYLSDNDANFKDLIISLVKKRRDFFSSDREVASLILALKKMKLLKDKELNQFFTTNESFKNRSNKIKESNSRRIRKPLKEGTGNFYFENRCVVVTDEDYENGNYPEYEKKPIDPYSRNYPQYPLIDYNDGLNCYRIVLTAGYYEAACIDYVEIECDELLDDFRYICENELPNIDYDTEEKTWYKYDDDTNITLEEAVNLIHSTLSDYPISKDDVEKALLQYKKMKKIKVSLGIFLYFVRQ